MIDPIRVLSLLAILAGTVTPTLAQSSKMTAFAADLTPAFVYLADHGIKNQVGVKATYDAVEAMYRPMSAEVAAQLIPFQFNNVHIPFALQGESVPEAKRRPGLQLGASYIKLEGSSFQKLSTCGTVLHELAHAEFFYNQRRRKTGRLQRQHDLMYDLRDHLVTQGVKKWEWPLFQASEMAAYYIETSMREVVERVEIIYMTNRWGANDIASRADREALVGADGKEELVIDRSSSRIQALFTRPIWKVGGKSGSAYYKGKPIDHAVPDSFKRRMYKEVLGLGLPNSGDELVALAVSLDTPWAQEQRQLITAARDARVRHLEAGAATVAEVPGMDDLFVAAGGSSASQGTTPELSEEELSLVARIENGTAAFAPGLHACVRAGNHSAAAPQ